MEQPFRPAHGWFVLTGRTDNFLWGISDIDDTIRRLCAYAEAELQTIGVRRISLGVDPYTHALAATQAAAAKLAKADLTALASNLNFVHIIDLIKG